jgi:2,4-dienoyl-CoA reductase-like NADH-dependent reductase (Old Yellow Enzyme family)/thioredoxin reductase
MNLVKKIMERRQFIVAAGVTPAAAIAYNKLTGVADPVFQTRSATAAETPGRSERAASFDSTRYAHLMSPLRIGNVILKNRIFSTNGYPHFLQGGENFPAEASRFYAANLAKNGAAIVTPRMIWGRERKQQMGDSAHMVIYDIEDTGVQNYLGQLIEGIHCFGAKATVPLYVLTRDQETIPPGPEHTVDPLSDEIVEQLIEEAIGQLKQFQGFGYDMATLQMVQYKGDTKQREGFSVKLCRALKKALGQDFLIGARISMVESDADRQRNSVAYTLEDIIGSAKQWEGIVDILQLMSGSGYMGFGRDKGSPPLSLKYAQGIKESGAKIFVAPNGGFGDLDQNEQYIKEGRADIIAMARQLISDWEYGKKMAEGRGGDVVPCLQCNKCHGWNYPPWITVCSVNPKVGIDSATRIIDAPTIKKKVAVIGAGPAGMKAAVTAAERGHKVTLYEKTNYMGGLLRHADFSNFKWPLMDFKDYLVRQVKKNGIEVVMNTAATPDLIKSKKYDAVLVAIGAEPNIPKIPGADGKNVYNIDSVYGKEKELGKNVVIVGAGAYSVETAIYLANAGHNITLLAGGKDLIETSGPHQLENIAQTFRGLKNCTSILNAITTSVANGKVTYKDASGSEKSIDADSVVLYAGLKARQDEAMKFSGSAGQIFVIGNCSGGTAGGVQTTQRSAFFAASQI